MGTIAPEGSVISGAAHAMLSRTNVPQKGLTKLFMAPPSTTVRRSNALVQLQARYHHCGDAASEK